MPYHDWRDAELPIPKFSNPKNPALLEIEANGGTVEIQRLGSDGSTWTTIKSFDTDSAEMIAVVGWKDWKIVALNGAKFRWAAF